jgi:hypothetical protein
MDFDKEIIRLCVEWKVRSIGLGNIKAEIASFRTAGL